MAKEYFSQADAIMRIGETICQYQKVPYYIMVDTSNSPDGVILIPLDLVGKLTSRDLAKCQRVKYTDPDFEYRSPPLGYMEYHNRACYIKRIPDRKQRQGLCSEILRAHFNDSEKISYDTYSLYYSKSFENMIMGRYKTAPEAEALIIDQGRLSVPISRTLAFRRLGGKTIALDFKTKFVGTRDQGQDKFRLFALPEADFLKKILSRQGVFCK